MKRKANPVEAAPLPTCSAIGPDDMIILACPSGEIYLVERNCALISGLCRDTIQLWENAVRRTALQQQQNKREQSSNNGHGGGDTNSVASPADLISTGFPNADREVMRNLLESSENQPTEIPFMPAWEPTAEKATLSLTARIIEVPVATVAERYQTRLDAAEAATPIKSDRPSSSKAASSHGDRKGMVMMPKPVSPLAPLGGPEGKLLYPVVRLPHMPAPLLEVALSYAYRKYRMDVDGERTAVTESMLPIGTVSSSDQWKLLAASVLSGM